MTMTSKIKRYLVIGGNPVYMYTGTTSFAGLSIVCHTNNLEEAQKAMNDNFDECGGLMITLDLLTGERI